MTIPQHYFFLIISLNFNICFCYIVYFFQFINAAIKIQWYWCRSNYHYVSIPNWITWKCKYHKQSKEVTNRMKYFNKGMHSLPLNSQELLPWCSFDRLREGVRPGWFHWWRWSGPRCLAVHSGRPDLRGTCWPEPQSAPWIPTLTPLSQYPASPPSFLAQ